MMASVPKSAGESMRAKIAVMKSCANRLVYFEANWITAAVRMPTFRCCLISLYLFLTDKMFLHFY